MVAEGELVAAYTLGRGVENSPPEPRAGTAIGGVVVSFRQLENGRVGVFGDDLAGGVKCFEPGGQLGAVIAGLLLVKVDGDQLIMNRRLALGGLEEIQERIAVLAAGDATRILSPSSISP